MLQLQTLKDAYKDIALKVERGQYNNVKVDKNTLRICMLVFERLFDSWEDDK